MKETELTGLERKPLKDTSKPFHISEVSPINTSEMARNKRDGSINLNGSHIQNLALLMDLAKKYAPPNIKWSNFT